MKPWNAALTSTLAMSSVTLADKVACLNGGIPTGIVASNCSYVTDNCWYNPLDTSSIYYRCIPRYNITATSVSTCAYPTYVTSSTDPRCILAKTDQSGTQYQPAKPNKLFNMLNTGINAYGRYFGDLEKTWWVILVCSVGIACATGFVFVQLVKTFVGCMVWTIITLTLLLMATLTGYFYWQAGLVNPTLAATVTTTLTTIPGATNAYSSMSTAASSSSATWGEYTTDSSSLTGYWSTGPSSPYAIMAYVSTFCCVVALCIVISVGSAIRKAIEVIQLGADALKATPSTLLMPLLSTSALCFFLVWWLFVAAEIASAGTSSTANTTALISAGAASISTYMGNSTYGSLANSLAGSAVTTMSQFTSSDNMAYLLIYHFFGLLWTASFIGAVTTITIAGAVCQWYFSEMPKDAPEELQKLKYPKSRFPTCGALYRAVRFHLGTAAIGSFLIALVQMVRWIFAYIAYKLKNNSSSVAKFFLCCINSCLACVECCIKILNRNAYIFAALKGDGFLGSGRRVFALIWAHGSIFAVVNVLGQCIVFMGKIIIAIVSAFSAYLILNHVSMFSVTGSSPITQTWLPTLITLFFGYVVGAGFLSVFDLAVESVLVCYCTDCDENEKSGGGPVPIHFRRDVLLKIASPTKVEPASQSGAPKQQNVGRIV